MSLVNIASSSATFSVIEGSILSTLVGCWTADLRIDQTGANQFPAGTKVTITSENGYSRTGVIDPARTGSRIDAVHVRVLGGAGGMVNKNATARSFMQPGAFAKDVVNGFLADSGETLDSTASQTFLGLNLTAWSVLGGNSVARSLKALIKTAAPAYNWRILANGNLWIGQETWPQASATFDVMDFDPSDDSYLIGSESPFIVPGQSLSGAGNVTQVLDTIANGRLRTRVWLDIPGTYRGTIDATQRMAIQALPTVDYHALYRARVVSQSSDLTTVDLLPDPISNGNKWPGMQRVPIRHGIPGTKASVNSGSFVLLGWYAGDPSKPYCALWEGTEQGDVFVQHLCSSQTGTPGLPPSSSDSHLTLDSTSSDQSGYFQLSGLAGGASVSIDVTYSRPYPNGSRVRITEADDTAAMLAYVDNSGSSVGQPVRIFIDKANTNKTKFRVKSSSGVSTKAPNGTFAYFVDGY